MLMLPDADASRYFVSPDDCQYFVSRRLPCVSDAMRCDDIFFLLPDADAIFSFRSSYFSFLPMIRGIALPYEYETNDYAM